jgi:hypothetical protein
MDAVAALERDPEKVTVNTIASSPRPTMRRCEHRQFLWEPSGAMDSALSATHSPTPPTRHQGEDLG